MRLVIGILKLKCNYEKTINTKGRAENKLHGRNKPELQNRLLGDYEE